MGLLLAGGLPGTVMAADSLDLLRYALSGGTPNLDLRLRYEDVEQDNALKDATAYTLRTRLGYTTAKWNDLDLQVELENVAALGDEDYNSCPGGVSPLFSSQCNGRTGRSVIADPTGTELNQFWLRYAGLPKTVLKFGRQRLILDNARFIGNVGWRQNEMTYDGFNLVNSYLPGSTVSYTRLTNANNIFGGNFQLDGDLLNIAWSQSEALKLVGYGYRLDFDRDVAARRDTETYGLRATGTLPLGAVKFGYAAEYATQDAYADSPSLVDADYRLLELGGTLTAIPLSAKLGYEVLGGDGVYGFQTPLATLHAFQGWADVFLNTPPQGIQDTYLQLGYTVEKVALTAVYHEFEADEGGADFGDEIDLQATRPINDNLSVTAKYADYSADSFSVDTQKLWLQFDYKF